MLKEGYSRRKTLISKTRLSPVKEANIDMRNNVAIVVMILFFLCVGNIFAGIEKIEVGIDGLSCPFCVWGLEKKFREITSVDKFNVHLKQAKAEVFLKSGIPLNIIDIKKAVKEAGFSTRYIFIIATGNLAEEKDGILFRILGTNQGFLLFETESAPRAELIKMLESRFLVRVQGKVHEHTEFIPSLAVEKIELVK